MKRMILTISFAIEGHKHESKIGITLSDMEYEKWLCEMAKDGMREFLRETRRHLQAGTERTVAADGVTDVVFEVI